MNLSFTKLILAFILVVFPLSVRAEEAADSVKYVPVVEQKPLQAAIGVVAPVVLYDFMFYRDDASIAGMRNHYLSGHKRPWDNVTQFIPVASMWGMRLAGVEGRSNNHWEALSAHTISYGIGLGITVLGKQVTGRTRPEDHGRHSFPSGHTMTAFVGAAVLDAEYGERYPWLSALGYGIATATGVGRILNNRHWATDVVSGAGVGIGSAYLGYLLNDLLWGRGLERFELYVERDLEDSPAFVRVEKGYHNILSGISDYKASSLGSSVGLTARVPLYKEWGVRAMGKLMDSYDSAHQEALNGWAALLGADYMRGLWGGRVWLEGHIALGYLSEMRLSKGALGQPRSVSTPMIAPSIPLNIGLGAKILTTDQLGVSLNTGYWYAPTAHAYDLSNRKGLRGIEFGVGLSYIIN